MVCSEAHAHVASTRGSRIERAGNKVRSLWCPRFAPPEMRHSRPRLYGQTTLTVRLAKLGSGNVRGMVVDQILLKR